MNHKRGRPKQQRAGCLFCKPHKGNHSKLTTREPVAARRAPTVDDEWFAPVNDCEAGTCDACACPWMQAPVDYHLNGSRVATAEEVAVAKDKIRKAWAK